MCTKSIYIRMVCLVVALVFCVVDPGLGESLCAKHKEHTSSSTIATLVEEMPNKKDMKRAIEKQTIEKNIADSIVSILKDGLNITGKITAEVLEKKTGSKGLFRQLADETRNDITRSLARVVLGWKGYGDKKKRVKKDVSKTKIGSVGLSDPLDITLKWTKNENGELVLLSALVDAGGGAINAAKTATNVHEPFGLVALLGSGIMADAWQSKIPQEQLTLFGVPVTNNDTRVNIFNIVDGVSLSQTMSSPGAPVAQAAMDALIERVGEMLVRAPHMQWISIMANRNRASDMTHMTYRAIVEKAHEHDRDVLIDVKGSTTEKDIRAVLEVARKRPQDILTPNIREFISILTMLQILPEETMLEDEDAIAGYAAQLVRTYNLVGMLITRDEQGIMFVSSDGRVIKEKAIPVAVDTSTGAGDATNVGFMRALSQGKSFEEAVHQANIFGAATVRLQGTQVATPRSIAHVSEIDRNNREKESSIEVVQVNAEKPNIPQLSRLEQIENGATFSAHNIVALLTYAEKDFDIDPQAFHGSIMCVWPSRNIEQVLHVTRYYPYATIIVIDTDEQAIKTINMALNQSENREYKKRIQVYFGDACNLNELWDGSSLVRIKNNSIDFFCV